MKDNLDIYTQILVDNANDNSNENINDFMTDGKFDLGKFNSSFENMKKNQKEKNSQDDDNRLTLLNDIINNKPLYKQTAGEIIIGIKDAWFYIINDLLQQKFTFNTFTQGNRLFYIGLTIFIIGIMLFIFSFFTDDEPKILPTEKIIEKHYYMNMENKNNNMKMKVKNNNVENSETTDE